MDQIKLTDIDSLPGYADGEDKVLAVGVLTNSNSDGSEDYLIFVINILDEGEDYEVDLAVRLTGSHAMSQAPTPVIRYQNDKYLVAFQDPDSKAIYAFDEFVNDSDLSHAQFLKVELPDAYKEHEIKIGYVENVMGIISRREGFYWSTAIDMSDGAAIWTETQPKKTFKYANTVCASCAISG